MSAEIETMAYNGELPWHGLGFLVGDDLTPQEMCKAAGVDWTVSKHEAYVKLPEETLINMSALVRDSDHKVLDVIGNDWNPVQNLDAFDFFSDFIKSGNMKMHTAGSLQGGRMVWALAKINDQSADLFNGDHIDSYLLFSNPHKYGHSIDVRFTPIRVVCMNTLTLSLSDKETKMVKLSHAKKFNKDEVTAMLKIAAMKLDKYKEMASFLGSKKYSDTSVARYFSEVFPVVSQKDEPRKDFSLNATKALAVLKSESQPGAEFAKGTYWQAFNTVTYLTDHIIGRTTDTRLTSSWYGQNKQLKLDALQKAVEFANKAKAA